jgi:hypothetical protein
MAYTKNGKTFRSPAGVALCARGCPAKAGGDEA